ncbi:MAG: hypothetical protein BJ554DRAFT_7171 [Olpidium bornovanus]|uniref:Phospholipid/glycerol acyltransferase domain-containing protein n=1 Tax=Olpidium bornovanus TaxID=278681 RepID=A0A8H7ZWL5_9FUNG|nr:MAG: hypothetical protein BJ554DRAFT_7171 [Olpidium bornovanus]
MLPYIAAAAAALALLAPPVALVLRNTAREPAAVARAQFALKVLLFALSLAASSLVGILAAPFLLLAGRRNDTCRVVGRTFRALCALFAGVSVRLQLPHHLATRPAIFVANHQSTLDVLVMGAVIPGDCTVIAKTSLRRVPLVGQFLWIDRKNTASAKEAMARAVDKIKASKMSCFVYPEGTRSHLKNAQLLPFKKVSFPPPALFFLDLARNAEVVVVAAAGGAGRGGGGGGGGCGRGGGGGERERKREAA